MSQTKPSPIQTQFSQLLKSTDIFAQVSEDNLEYIANVCKLVKFEAQTRIVNQGEESDDLYIIGEGRVAVIHEEPDVGTEQLVTTLGPKSAFGEASLLTGSPRSATIKTLEETICVQLSRSSFESVLKLLPEVSLEVCRYLAARLHHQCQLTGFRFVSLQDLSYEPDLYGMFPTDLLRRLKAIPFKVQEDTLTVALVNPYQSSVVKDLREAAPGFSIEAVVCTLEDYEAFLRRNRPPTTEVEAPTLLLGEISAPLCLPDGSMLEPPLSTLLREALNRETRSLIVQQDRVLTPLDRELEAFVEFPDAESYALLQKQIQENFFSQDEGAEVVSCTLSLEPRFCHIELSRVTTTRGPRFSIHLTESRTELPALSELFLSKSMREKIVEELQTRGRVVVLSGPPLSGLTSTAHSVLCALHKDNGIQNILTIEREPFASTLELPQVQMGADFGASLRASLMQSPRLLMVDDLNPEEVPTLVRQMSDGISVLLCLETSSPEQLFLDLCKQGRLDHNDLGSLGLLVGQELLPRLCPHCREQYQPTVGVRNQLKKFGLSDPEERYFRSEGCEKCFGSGSAGRVLVTQSLAVTDVIREFLLAGRAVEAIRKLAESHGLLIPFKVSLAALMRQGDLSPAVALRFFGSRK